MIIEAGILIVINVAFLMVLKHLRQPDGTLTVTENGGKKKVTLELTTDPEALEHKDQVIFRVEQVSQS